MEKKYKQRYRKRLILNIEEDFHAALVRAADHKKTTIRNYVLQACAEQIMRDKIHE